MFFLIFDLSFIFILLNQYVEEYIFFSIIILFCHKKLKIEFWNYNHLNIIV